MTFVLSTQYDKSVLNFKREISNEIKREGTVMF